MTINESGGSPSVAASDVPDVVCPHCGSPKVAEVVYGVVDPEVAAAAERGEAILAGCATEPWGYGHVCRRCEYRF
jgi:hypothetical protein